MSELLALADISVAFPAPGGTAQVLDRVSLSLAEGEIMGLVGESGCGKTTLARLILGVLPAGARVAGRALCFAGHDLLADPAGRRNLAGRAITFVPQDPGAALSPLFTIGTQAMEVMRWCSPVRERGERGYSRARRTADRQRVIEMLGHVQLPDPNSLLRRYPHELSGGQRQRLLIAMALLPEPRLIIADEPTTALDVTIQAQILKLLRRLAVERGVAVLFTTHDLGTAWEICDRVGVMYAGQEVEAAPVAEFFASPRHPYTGLLLQSLDRADDGLPAGIPGAIPSPLAPPPGCRFHPRCPRALPVCAVERPARQDSAECWVRCHNPLPMRPAA